MVADLQADNEFISLCLPLIADCTTSVCSPEVVACACFVLADSAATAAKAGNMWVYASLSPGILRMNVIASWDSINLLSNWISALWAFEISKTSRQLLVTALLNSRSAWEQGNSIDTFNHDRWHLFLFSTSPFPPLFKKHCVGTFSHFEQIDPLWAYGTIETKMCRYGFENAVGILIDCYQLMRRAASFPLLHCSTLPSLPGELANALTFLAQQLALSSIARWDPCPTHSVQSWIHRYSVSYTLWAGRWMESKQCTLRLPFVTDENRGRQTVVQKIALSFIYTAWAWPSMPFKIILMANMVGWQVLLSVP